jgi:dipeptidyl aminopeptidase/acylaminoacyl peptidase
MAERNYIDLTKDIPSFQDLDGVPVEYVIYPNEGHGFAKKENQMTTSRRTLEFLDKYLKPKSK